MKRCPTCQKTYEDSMRFCQLDGAALIEETADPLKTTGGVPFINQDEDLVPPPADQSDNTKTLISSDNFGRSETNFNSNSLWDESVNQSPFDSSPNASASSPFNEQASLGYQPPSFKEHEETKTSESGFGTPQTPFNQNPFEQPQSSVGHPMQQSSWTPPPAPEANWQNQNIGANTPFQPPISLQGQDKTLAIVSLVCGILSLTCCGPVTGIAALITGFMAKNNVDANPQQYEGRGMAIAGMIMGGISLVLTLLYFIFVVLFGFFGR